MRFLSALSSEVRCFTSTLQAILLKSRFYPAATFAHHLAYSVLKSLEFRCSELLDNLTADQHLISGDQRTTGKHAEYFSIAH